LLRRWVPKRLEVLREIILDLARVAVLWTNRADAAEQLRETDRAAHALGIAIVRIEVNAPEDMEKAFQAIVQEHANAVAVLTAPQFVPMSERIAAFRLKHRLPAIAGLDGFVPLGGLVTYGPQRVRRLARSGNLVAKILRGEKTADMPIRQPAKFELVINLKTAKAPSHDPPSLLRRADEVIE
jgi:putative tryptophan/tyrosine transport system substrate-binding protein